ncbi:MAG: I78 family peptidase inhibitor [Pseudomonadota bacterium]
MITRTLFAASFLILMGCTTTSQPLAEQPSQVAPPVAEEPANGPQRPPRDMLGVCNAQPVQIYVGETVTTDLGATILSESGAKSLRWGPPRSAWTMDYRNDRVNVRYDDNSTIIAITCG